MPDHRPNILLFMTDHGQSQVFDPAHPAVTPNADRLVAAGVRFSEAYCPTAHCCPSRATFMTGLMPSRHGVFNNVSNSSALRRDLLPGVGTFGEELAEGGYRMVFCGKWHVSDTRGPRDFGWEERAVTSNRGASRGRLAEQWWRDPPPAATGPRRAGEIVRPGWGNYQLYGSPVEPDRPHPDEVVVGAALDTLRELRDETSPWCLFVGPIGPHDPYVVERRWVDRYDLDDVALPDSFEDDLRDKPNIYRRMREQLWDQLSEEETRDAVRHYLAYCTYEDDLLGRLLDALDEQGRADDTVMMLLSDHGDYVGAHGLFLKGVPAFREAYHVPAVVRWPAGIADPGRRVSALVSLADFCPTFLELAGVSVETGRYSGSSLVPFLQGDEPEGWRTVLGTQLNGVELYYSQRAVISRDWKYVYNGFDFDELYARADDPAELRNVAADERHTDRLGELSEELWRLAEAEDDWLIRNRYPTVAFAPRGPIGHLKASGT